MRSLARSAGLLAVVAGVLTLHAAEPKAQTQHIGAWRLTAEKFERTPGEGGRVAKLTATGAVRLVRSQPGAWTENVLAARAEEIVADFTAKKFVLRGSPLVRDIDRTSRKVIREVAGGPETAVELSFEDAKMVIKGEHRMKVGDGTEPEAIGKGATGK
jgi:hypothetical protein